MNSRIYRKTQKQIFLLDFGQHFVPLKGTPTWRLHTKLHKFGCIHQNAVEYNAGKSLFINFIEGKIRLDLTLFSIRRSQYFTSQTRSLIFNGRLEHDTAASSKKVTRHLSLHPFLVTWVWYAFGSKVDNTIHQINLHPPDRIVHNTYPLDIRSIALSIFWTTRARSNKPKKKRFLKTYKIKKQANIQTKGEVRYFKNIWKHWDFEQSIK